jgi:KUP system potassium uptake protein
MTMVITTVLFFEVLRRRFRWRLGPAVAVCGTFLLIDVAFLGANIPKIPHGGWFPLVVGALVFTGLTTWQTGRELVRDRIVQRDSTLARFLSSPSATGAVRVPGTAVYLFSIPDLTPPALVANLEHNRSLHEQVLLVSIVTADAARVPQEQRSDVRSCPLPGVHQVILHYGFMEDPDVPAALRQGGLAEFDVDTASASYFLGAESLVVTERPGMAEWRERLFVAMSRNATSAANYFNLPADRTVTLGTRVEL